MFLIIEQVGLDVFPSWLCNVQTDREGERKKYLKPLENLRLEMARHGFQHILWAQKVTSQPTGLHSEVKKESLGIDKMSSQVTYRV